jgi:hypothetical protein
VEELLGIDINYTFVLDTDKLGKVVDIIEGVELLIPQAVQVYDEDTPILFPHGIVQLDGSKSQVYVTYELPEENNEIVAFRRQRFFRSFIKRLGEQNNILKDPMVIPFYYKLIRTNMNQHVMLRLFDEYTKIDADQVSIQSVGGNVREVSGRNLLFPYYDGSLIKDIVRQSLRDLTRPMDGTTMERILTVEILNGTATNGLAGRTAELLRGFGYDVISIDNAETNYDSTLIIDRSGVEAMARSFGDIIHCKNIRFEAQDPEHLDMTMNIQNLEYRSDFILIIGSDFNGRYVSGG